eukprot:7141745-Alexandrium_andersonii.AAC.1
MQKGSGGNRLARWGLRAFRAAALAGTPVALENPASGRLCLLPAARRPWAQFSFQFGSEARKRM